MKIALGIQYDGTAYHGWQSQTGSVLPTIQTEVEKALSKVANHPVKIICAGRTDTGVHACCQVVHFEAQAERSDYSWVAGGNSYLPDDIALNWAKTVSEDFHARFSAIARQYRYIICNASIRPALFRRQVGWCYQPLVLELMEEAAQHLLGKHDFSSFRGAACQAHSPIRTVNSVSFSAKNSFIIFDIEANAFLHHMVRNIVGALMDVGMKKYPPHGFKDLLELKDRTAAGIAASASGLYLKHVIYPQDFELPESVDIML